VHFPEFTLVGGTVGGQGGILLFGFGAANIAADPVTCRVIGE